MDWAEFEQRLGALRATHPKWFSEEGEPLPSQEALVEAEQALGVKLPETYKAFLRRFGGGYFGATNVFGVSGGDWDIVAKNLRYPLPERFIAVSDDQAGGYYGFIVASGACSPEVVYCYPMEADGLKPVATDFLSYLVKVGLDLP